VSYPVVPIPGHDLSGYVTKLEEANIRVLASFGIVGERRPGHPGIYVGGDKISSIGLRCQRWVSSHGTSLNVSVDLSLFDAIVSCGEPQLRQTSIERLIGFPPDMAEVKTAYLRAVVQVFGWALHPLRPLSYERVESELGLEGMPTAGFEPATPGSGGQCSIP
jgi:lipoate-protein ligase B